MVGHPGPALARGLVGGVCKKPCDAVRPKGRAPDRRAVSVTRFKPSVAVLGPISVFRAGFLPDSNRENLKIDPPPAEGQPEG